VKPIYIGSKALEGVVVIGSKITGENTLKVNQTFSQCLSSIGAN
jgi:hypothetical protein